ncbi:hypothetical protein [Aquimarina sp. 2304DJ70-9]|uniref:hypothetical protein n=1 Tax=Aquimarina penaris TaxID=3231044 RepID=UPI00346211DD
MSIFIFMVLSIACQKQDGKYVCTPCDQSCDALFFSEPGVCPHCNMKLIKKSELKAKKELVVNAININEGSGEFLIDGGVGNKEKTIKVYYHKPKNYRPESRILIVVPGAGRNGDSYRNAWIEESEKYGVLILSLMYPEKEYDFGAYHLCGIMHDLDIKNSIEYVENTNVANMDESKFTFKINENQDEWIFNDFDRVFDLTVQKLKSAQTTYDIFGHSAGGQILHRMAIFQKESKAKYIIAGNSGFYTLPSNDFILPFGVKNAPFHVEHLPSIFKKKLIVMIGELDNATEKGGTLLHSVSVDKQGLHRLERGTFFFKYSKTKAQEMGLDFNWELKIVPNTGHNHKKIGDAAARYLYESAKR